jgi:hypothetical protein
VLAGLALGWSWFLVCAIAFGGTLLRYGATAKVLRQATVAGEPQRRRRASGSVETERR